jgi:hypothetical protein
MAQAYCYYQEVIMNYFILYVLVSLRPRSDVENVSRCFGYRILVKKIAQGLNLGYLDSSIALKILVLEL